MGTGFTLDSPLRVARFGITSVISLVDDTLIEQVHRYHAQRLGFSFAPVAASHPDRRAKRITAYLDFLDQQIKAQIDELRSQTFDAGTDLTRYFEILPSGDLRSRFEAMRAESDPEARRSMEDALREAVQPGEVEVNIMTKLNRDRFVDGKAGAPEEAEALTALRGFAQSTLTGSVVFSAGFNPVLYGYMESIPAFAPDRGGRLTKRIVLKVSDYRSAQIQGRFLAKRGLWVSEFRIESGLNCGGHAFATEGVLLGPALEEFKQKREKLLQGLGKPWRSAMESQGRSVPETLPPQGITAQGGIGTAEEHRYLLDAYDLDGTGWGSPLLLVPEATTVDEEHLEKLLAATRDDVFISESSPLEIPFWTLRTSASELAKKERAQSDRPGSPCTKRHLAFNSKYGGEPLCLASCAYLEKRLPEIDSSDLSEEERQAAREHALGKACICHDLGGGVLRRYGINEQATPAICPGPGILAFTRTATLDEMTDHIYGRASLLADGSRTPMFLEELGLYVNLLQRRAKQTVGATVDDRVLDALRSYRDNLLQGISYYEEKASEIAGAKRDSFLAALAEARSTIHAISLGASPTSAS